MRGAVHTTEAASRAHQGDKRPGVRPPHTNPGRSHSAGARGPGPDGLRPDWQRQDRRFRAADHPPAHRQAAALDQGAGARAHARAGGADSRRLQCLRGAHAGDRRGRVRRRQHGAAGARLPKRRRRHHRDARPPDGSHAVELRAPEPHRVSGAGRGRPHARHGLPAGDPPHPRAAAVAAPDAVLQRHDAGADCRARQRDAAQPGVDCDAAPVRAGVGHHAGGLSGLAGAEVLAARAPADATGR